jgi:hypothetical protein
VCEGNLGWEACDDGLGPSYKLLGVVYCGHGASATATVGPVTGRARGAGALQVRLEPLNLTVTEKPEPSESEVRLRVPNQGLIVISALS